MECMMRRRMSSGVGSKGSSRVRSREGRMSRTEAEAVSAWIARGIRCRERKAEAVAVGRLKGKRKGKEDKIGTGKPVQFGAWSAEL